MKINNINGIQSAKNYFELPKKRKVDSEDKKSDRVEISTEAKAQASVNPLRSLVIEYLHKTPSIRKERVEDVTNKVNEGYRLDSNKLSTIAERILKNFGL